MRGAHEGERRGRALAHQGLEQVSEPRAFSLQNLITQGGGSLARAVR
jgi:hypothetical protein